MTQLFLSFDRPVRRLPNLPYSGRTVISRECSKAAARAASVNRESKTARYLAWMQAHAPASDHQAADALRLPLSSVCSIRNGVNDRAKAEGRADVIVAAGKAEGKYGVEVTLWRVA